MPRFFGGGFFLGVCAYFNLSVHVCLSQGRVCAQINEVWLTSQLSQSIKCNTVCREFPASTLLQQRMKYDGVRGFSAGFVSSLCVVLTAPYVNDRIGRVLSALIVISEPLLLTWIVSCPSNETLATLALQHVIQGVKACAAFNYG